MQAKTIRLIALARISDPNKEEADDSILRQREMIGHYFASQDNELKYELVDIVPEVQSAADGDNRPVLAGVLARIYNGEADGLIVARLDRLSRDQAHGHTLLKTLRRKKKGLICIYDGLNSFYPDNSFDYVFGIKLLIAERQKVDMCNNMLEAKRRLTNQEGVHVTGKVRFGWRLGDAVKKPGWKKEKRELVPVTAELQVIKEAMTLKQSGWSDCKIAIALKGKNYKTRSGGEIDGTYVRNVLIKSGTTHEPTVKWLAAG